MIKQILCWCVLAAMIQACSLSCADQKKEVPFTRQLIEHLQRVIFIPESPDEGFKRTYFSNERMLEILRYGPKSVIDMLYGLLVPATPVDRRQDSPYYMGTKIQRAFSFHKMIPTTLCFSPDNVYALAGYRDGTIRIWYCPTFFVARTYSYDDCRDEVTAVSFSPDGSHILVGYESGTIKMISRVTEEVTATLHQTTEVSTVCCSSNNRMVLSGAADENLHLWHREIDKPSQTFRPRGRRGLVRKRIGLCAAALSPSASLAFGVFDETQDLFLSPSYVLRGWWQRTGECCLICSGCCPEVSDEWSSRHVDDDRKYTKGEPFALPLWNSRRGELQGMLKISPDQEELDEGLIVNTNKGLMDIFARDYDLIVPSACTFPKETFEQEMQACLSKVKHPIGCLLFLTLLALTKHPLVEWFGHLGRPYSPSFLDMACQASAQFLTEGDFSSEKGGETVQKISELATWLKFIWDDVRWPGNVKNYLTHVFHVPSEIETDFPILGTAKRYAARYNTSVEVLIPEATGEYVYF